MSNSKVKRIVDNVFHYSIAMILISSGLLKIAHVDFYQNILLELHPVYHENMLLLGVIAVVSGLLLCFKKTYIYGFIMSLVFFGGTIAAHMQHKDIYIPQIVFVLVLVYVTYRKNSVWFQQNIH
ncbi:hypothetical protein [uncultured Kordia sp.]|uniref:hypothetical protein n=1 Tax=uncultured Kordia sp. TaxID=507699 RepID=UPI00260A0600|nr:hypothetical protein [uncultured Kordia sp.]